MTVSSKTEKQKFLQYLEGRGFKTSPNLATLPLIPHHYKTDKGNHVLISSIGCSYFIGANQSEEELGCVCFFYMGVERLKYHRHIWNAEILKQVEVYRLHKKVIKDFEKWELETAKTLASWKTIM